MALQARSASEHNRALGQRIAHPKSTNFDDFGDPPAKRMKRDDSVDTSLSRASSVDDSVDSHLPEPMLKEIKDSEDESEDEFHSSQTDLESALPPVKTDKEAIEAYEASRAAEEAGAEFLQQRLGSRKWTKGKSSIYVDAFNLALETVLEEEIHLFDETETAVFNCWRSLSYEAQYL